MTFLEAIRLAFNSIRSHKLRSFLTLLGCRFTDRAINTYVDEKIANIGTNTFSVHKYSIDDFSSVETLNAVRRRNKDVRVDDLKTITEKGQYISNA